MAGVSKHPKSPYWTGIFYDGTGKKVRRTTGLSNKKAAKVLTEQWEKLARAGAKKQLTEVDARKVVAEIFEHYTGEQMAFFSAKGWVEEFLASKEAGGRSDALKKYARVGKAFIEFLGAKRADCTIAGVTMKDVRLFREQLRAKRTPQTVNQLMRKLAAIFRGAQRMGYTTTNPCGGLDPLEEEDARRDPFTTAQVSQLLEAADDEWFGAILFGFQTGLRLSDIAGLEWQNIDLGERVLRVKPSKTKRSGKTLAIPLHGNLIEWLKTRTKTPKVFPSLAGKVTSGKDGLSAKFARIMQKAGIAGRNLRESSIGRATSSLSFHSLRHTMISAMANAKVAADIRKKLSGHSSDSSHQIYTHHDIETMREAIDCLPSVTATKPTEP